MSKKILDACCGGRHFWFDKTNPDVLFIDRRVMPPTVVGSGKCARVRKCLPDKVMDFRKMDLPDHSFKLVVFDPPHLFLGENSYMAKACGSTVGFPFGFSVGTFHFSKGHNGPTFLRLGNT